MVSLLFILISAAGESLVTFETRPAVFQPQVLRFLICDLLCSGISAQSLLSGRWRVCEGRIKCPLDILWVGVKSLLISTTPPTAARPQLEAMLAPGKSILGRVGVAFPSFPWLRQALLILEQKQTCAILKTLTLRWAHGRRSTCCCSPTDNCWWR